MLSLGFSLPLGWTLEHAIRELWQNFRDGVAAAFGEGSLVPSFRGDGRRPRGLAGHIALSREGVPVGSVDASTPDVLIFRQRFAVLQPRHLALASVKSGNAVGAHGEGFKVAINFLLKRGFTVTYTMDGQCWHFEHRALHDAVVKNMVRTRGGVGWGGVTVGVGGWGRGAVEALPRPAFPRL